MKHILGFKTNCPTQNELNLLNIAQYSKQTSLFKEQQFPCLTIKHSNCNNFFHCRLKTYSSAIKWVSFYKMFAYL